MEKILITGGTGLIGKNLIPVLQQNGFEVVQLVRKIPQNSSCKSHLWNPDQNELDESVFIGVDHIIHLAGENIGAKRWTKSRKKKLYDSRIKTANLLFEKSKNANIKTFITASGVNIYGTKTSEKIFTEEDSAESDFLSQLTLYWEKAAEQFSSRGARIVKIRTGVVLSEKGEHWKK
ncbi:MAG: NAD-dependent epimerase/dehydratase family protein [Crocinitomicaceae bacterium]|nr:NAD-dependent epimerase/dehydratase family protein [Crocinitomicaceae bacterium]